MKVHQKKSGVGGRSTISIAQGMDDRFAGDKIRGRSFHCGQLDTVLGAFLWD